MLEFFKTLFAVKEYIPHGHCYFWQSELMALHVVSDSLIAIAYYSIPFMLLYFVRKRQDLTFSWIFLLFACFIVSCGTNHLMEIWTIWYPTYWVSGSIKAITALASLYTAYELINFIPKALAFPSPAQLEAANRELQKEISERQQVEAALRSSEERWQLAIAGTNEGIWDWNILTNETFRSERWFKMLGYEPHELGNHHHEWSKLIHPDDFKRVIVAQAAYLLRQTPEYNIEYRLRHRDGNYRWFRSRGKAVWNEQGNAVRLVGSLGDIGDRKQVELALQEQEAMLRHIGDNVPNGAIYKVIRELDGSDRFCYLSAGITKLMEVSAADALKDSSLLYSQFIPEDVPRLQAATDESIRNLSVFDIQLRICTPSGQLKWLHFSSSPRQLDDGCVAWDGLVVDVTEIKHTEVILRKNEALLEESQRVARLGNWEHDLATDKISWSKGLFELFKRDPKLSPPSYEENLELYHPESQEKLDQAVMQAISTGESYKLVLRATRCDGVEIYVEAIGYADFNATGEVIRLYGTAQDISDRKYTEAALARTEEQQRLTLEFTHIGTWDWNVQTGEVIWNDQICRLLGLDSHISTSTYQLWRNAVHPEDIERVEKAVFNALQKHTNFEAEYRVILPNGEIRWLTGKGRGIYNTADQPVRMLGIIIDISDRKQAEQTLQEKENFLRSIYDGVEQAIFVVDIVDNDFRFVALNHAHEEMTGLRSDELRGKTPEQALSPTVAAMVRQHYQDCLAAGATITYEECLPFQGQETCWITSITPLKDENLRIYRIVGTSINITEQKRAQQLLELQAVITRNMAEGICLIRADDGIIVYANPKFEEMFGYDTNELTGLHVSIVNYEDEYNTVEEVYQAIRTAILENGEFAYEVHNVKKDGTDFWSKATASVFEHPDYGKVLVAVQQDITEHKQAEEQIKASLKEKEVLLKEIHHRVKNNLGIVSSLLQMQCRRNQDSQAAAILRDSQNRIASIALVHEKLYRSVDLANIDCSQYIADLTTHLFDSYNVSSNRIKLDIQVDDLSLDIETAIPCGLIINELVSNALKYAFCDHRTGEIQVKLYQPSQGNFTLIVQDNGVGLPADFDHKKTKTLGITLVQGLVKQLGGNIEINSQQGTEFIINFAKSKA